MNGGQAGYNSIVSHDVSCRIDWFRWNMLSFLLFSILQQSLYPYHRMKAACRQLLWVATYFHHHVPSASAAKGRRYVQRVCHILDNSKIYPRVRARGAFSDLRTKKTSVRTEYKYKTLML